MSAPGVVVVGTGQAAAHLAMSLRQGGYDDRVTLIGEEPDLPYERPPLSKVYLTGEVADDDLMLRPSSFWTDRRVELRTGETVRKVDRSARRVILASGETIGYSHLVLATGGSPRRLPVPGAAAPAVHALRTVGDAAAVRKQLSTGSPLVVVGGGYIGLEVAAAAAKSGCAVTVVEQADRMLTRGVSVATADALAEAHRAQGVTLLTGTSVEAVLSKDGQVSGVLTGAGDRIPCAGVVVGVGLRPREELARDAGLPTDDGVLVDDQLLTEDPSISAIGDCARFLSDRGRVRLESVQNATDQARHVARRLTEGASVPYREVPWFWTEQYDLRVQIVGLSDAAEELVVREDPGGGAFSVYAFRSGVLCAVESVNQPRIHLQARKILAAGVPVAPAQIVDGVDLKSLLPR